jgi:hypothetical protein
MTNPNPNPATRFAPGNNGRPKGSRNKLGDQFVERLQADFDEHGVDVIKKVRSENPTAYFVTLARLLPKEMAVAMQIEQKLPANLTTDEWNRLVWLLSLPEHLGAKGTPDEIASRIEHALRSEFAKPALAIEHTPILAPPPY